MALCRWSEYRTVYEGSTQVLKFRFLQRNGQFVQSLVGRAAWVSFWWPEATVPHIIRQAKVDGAGGRAIYFPQGDEFATAGKDVLMQATAQMIDVDSGVDRGFLEFSFPIVRWHVVPAAA